MPRFRPDGNCQCHPLSAASRISSAITRTLRRKWNFAGAYAQRVGPEGRGVPTIIEMVQLTRFRLHRRIGRRDARRIGASNPSYAASRRCSRSISSINRQMRAVIADLARSKWKRSLRWFLVLHARSSVGARSARHGLSRGLSSLRQSISLLQERAILSSMRRSNAWAATAMSRSCRWRGSIARRRSSRSGEGSGNVMALDVLRAIGRHPKEAMSVLDSFARATADVFQAQPLVHALTKLMRSGEAERRARYVCESSRPSRGAGSSVRAPPGFPPDYARTRLYGAGARHLGGARPAAKSEAALIERAFAT